MLKKNLLPFTLITLLIILAFVLFNRQTTPTHTIEPTQLAQDEWHLYQSTSWIINKTDHQPNNSLTLTETPTQQILTSPFMRHQQNTTYITQPNLQQIEPEKHTRLTSNTAKINQDKTYEFFNKVIIHTQPNQEKIQTEYLKYSKSSQLITSDQYVEIYHPQQKTSGIGLKLNPKTDKLELFSQVKTYYQPQEDQDETNN